jgi:hypothetical protein
MSGISDIGYTRYQRNTISGVHRYRVTVSLTRKSAPISVSISQYTEIGVPYADICQCGRPQQSRLGCSSSEGCFSEPRLLASRHPLCPNSISVLLCLQSVLTTVYCQMLAFGTTLALVHLILIEFKEHFKLVMFLGIRTGTSCPCQFADDSDRRKISRSRS